MDVWEILDKFGFTSESLQRVRLGRGLIGRMATAFWGVCGLLIVVAFKLNDPWMLVIIAGTGSILFLALLIGVLWFGHRNPGPALLEGSQLIVWRQVELAAKGLVAPPQVPATADPQAPALPEELDEFDEGART
jgi:hypothetical protein